MWAFLSGFIVAILIAIYILYPKYHSTQPNKETYPSFSPVSTARALPYYEANIWDNCYRRPQQIAVKIILADTVKTYTPDELCATCMAAAKYYSAKNGSIPAKITIFNSLPEIAITRNRLGECAYSPQGKVWNRTQEENWVWNKILVTSEDRLSPGNEARRIYEEIDSHRYRDRHANIEKVAKIGNMDWKTAWDAIWDGPPMLNADYKKLENIQPEAPLAHAPALVKQNNAKILAETAKLYKELEEFWSESGPDQEKLTTWTKGAGPHWNLSIDSLWAEARKY